MMRRLVSLVTVLSLLTPYVAYAAEPAAAAVDAGAQDVLFKNGSKVRGQVIDIVPGDHVTLRFKSGEARRFEWADVDRVVPASGPEPPPPPAAKPPTAPTPAPTTPAPTTPAPAPSASASSDEKLPPVTGPTVRVHINSPGAAQLARRAQGMHSYVRVCDAPCDLELPIADDYMLSASGAKTTSVKLTGQPGQTEVIDISPPSDAGKIGGVVMIVGGALGLLVGLPVDLVGAAVASAKVSGGDTILIVGLVITGVSLGVGIGGIVVLLKSGNTDVTSRTGQLDVLPTAPKADDRFVRAPVWHMPDALERTVEGRAQTTIPILTRSF